jgi:hypothetical protein
VEQELSGRSEDAEQRLVASTERVRQEVFRLGRAQQSLLGLVRITRPPGQGCANVRSRAGWGGSRRREGARPARPLAEERGPHHGRGLAIGNAGFGEPRRCQPFQGRLPMLPAG